MRVCGCVGVWVRGCASECACGHVSVACLFKFVFICCVCFVSFSFFFLGGGLLADIASKYERGCLKRSHDLDKERAAREAALPPAEVFLGMVPLILAVL